jgi:DNA-binding NtrC family response regulator
LAKILIIDDENAILSNLRLVLEGEGYDIITVSGGMEEIIGILDNRDIDVVIADLEMPDASGMDVMRAVKQLDPDMVLSSCPIAKIRIMPCSSCGKVLMIAL